MNKLPIQGPHTYIGYLLRCSCVSGGEVGRWSVREFAPTTCSFGAYKKVYRKTPEQDYP